MSDILGLLKRARERAPRANPHCPPDCDDCSYVIALDAAIERLERATIVQGWAAVEENSAVLVTNVQPTTEYQPWPPAVLIVLDADDE